jgi:uncharacterized membrane protein YbhN (UPF0104 family)
MLISMLSHYLRAYRANMLYEPMGYRVSNINSFYAVMIGYMMNYVIPRAGEVSRCAALNKTDGIPVEKSLGTVITERIVDLVFMFLLLGLIFIIQFRLIIDFIKNALENKTDETAAFPWKWLLIGVFALGLLVLFLLRKKIAQHPAYQKVMSLLIGLKDGLSSIKRVKNPVLFVALSMAIWICYVMMMYFCLFAMQATEQLGFTECLTVFALGTIGVALPSPGGIGSYHYFVSQALILFGVAADDGLAYATMVHGAQMILLMAIGAICSILVLLQQKNAAR